MSSLGNFVNNLSKNVIVFIALVGGVFFIVLSDPPHTVCNTQIKNFKEVQKGFLYLSKKPKKAKPQTLYSTLYANCRDSNSPGGCYEFFVQLQKMLKDSEAITISVNGEGVDCRDDIGSVKEFKKAIWVPLELMVRMAWTEKPPSSYIDKKNWFGPSELKTFCQLKRRALEVYGDERWNSFVDSFFKNLPQVKTLPRKKAWSRMLLSINCANYL